MLQRSWKRVSRDAGVLEWPDIHRRELDSPHTIIHTILLTLNYGPDA